MHDFKVSFCMHEIYIRKITSHRFHVDNNESESGIGYEMIIVRYLMLQLGLLSDFKPQFLQCYSDIVPMKYPGGLLGQSDIISCKMHQYWNYQSLGNPENG